jgi:hypothetical protein
MLGFYYKIWVDCITRINLQPEANKKNWQVTCMVAMTFAMTSNLVLILILLQKCFLGYYFYELNLAFLPQKLNALVEFAILYILPCLILNYLLIFRNKRYENLLQIYPYKYNGKLFAGYFMVSVGLPVILLVTSIVYSKL